MIPLHHFASAVVMQAMRSAPLCDEKVEFAWRLVVGPAMSKATRVRLDAAGVLHVSATDVHWRREVERSSSLIRSRLESVLGPDAVNRISASL